MSKFKFKAWPTEHRTITQYFGANPQNYAQFGLPGHEGLDIVAPTGSKVFAVAPGTVKLVRKNGDGHNYGVHVRITHDDGYETIYGHLQEAKVNEGDVVEAGDLIGLADNTGNSFGSHLHLTLKRKGARQGKWPNNIIDPTPFLLPLLGWEKPAGPYTEGWVYTNGIITNDDLAQASAGGVNLRQGPTVHADIHGLVPAGTIMIITGQRRGNYTPVRVATRALPQAAPPPPPPPAPPPPQTVAMVDGWAWKPYLNVSGEQAVVGEYGINLRTGASRQASNVGVVRGGSTVTVLGDATGEYLPVRARRQDFIGPVRLPNPLPTPTPGSIEPPEGSVLGWAWTPYLTKNGRQAIVGRFGINLRGTPSRSGQNIGLVKGGSAVAIVGFEEGEYTPVFARKDDILNLLSPLPVVTPPIPFPEEEQTRAATEPAADSTPGYAFTSQLQPTGGGGTAEASRFGASLFNAPRRTAERIGYIPAAANVLLTGAPVGEFTPVRVADDVLQSPDAAAADTDPTPLGQARIGLHASADPEIKDDEVAEFARARPGMIKVLSFHNPKGIRKLAQAHPDATWVVRAFLDFGGRNIRPEQFVQFTLSDMRRTLDILRGRDLVIELHNEPNLTAEGLSSSWRDGADFAQWWMELLRLYRQALPGARFIYPGLSPGSDVAGLKHDHVRFIEASRKAVDVADGLGVHLYWSEVYPMELALRVLDDYISRFRNTPIWVTEASNNKGGTTPYRKAMQYIEFWRELQKRPLVQGVTYFVASASNPDFAEEVWVGRDIGMYVGRR